MAMGNDKPGPAASSTSRANVIVVTTQNDGLQTLTIDEITYMEMLDTAIDGVADAAKGRVRSMDSATFTVGGRIVNDVGDLSATSTAWGDASSKGMVYYFDRDPAGL